MEVHPALSEMTTKITVRFRSQINIICETGVFHNDAITLAGIFAQKLMERCVGL
jgi:hypothetical protein